MNERKKEAKELGTSIVNDSKEKPSQILIESDEYIETPDEFFADLSDIIINLLISVRELPKLSIDWILTQLRHRRRLMMTRS